MFIKLYAYTHTHTCICAHIHTYIHSYTHVHMYATHAAHAHTRPIIISLYIILTPFHIILYNYNNYILTHTYIDLYTGFFFSFSLSYGSHPYSLPPPCLWDIVLVLIIDRISQERTDVRKLRVSQASTSRGTHGILRLPLVLRALSRTPLNGLRVVRRRVEAIGGSVRRRLTIGRGARPTSGAV